MGVSPVAAEWQRALNELIHRMRVAAPIRLLASELAAAPAVVGWLRPVILMPVEALAGLPIEKVRAVLAHELAHIRRHDYPVNLLQSVVETVLFYHPAVWWISAQVRAEREACCDDMTVAATGDVLVYASALADLASRRRARLQAVLAASGGSLVNRIRRLVGEPQPESHDLSGPGVAWALSVLWLAGIGAAALHSAPTLPEPGAGVTHRRFAAPQAGTAAPFLPDQAPRTKAAPLSPLISALLFDPLFSLAAAPAPPAAAAPQAQAAQATLDGRVVNAVDKTPIAGARVQMVQPYGEGEPVYAKTDAEGHFQFPRTAVGSYALVAEGPGFLRTQELRNAHDTVWLVDLVMPAEGSPWVRPLGTTEIPGVGAFTKSVDPDGPDGSVHGSVVIPLTPYAVIAGKVTEPSGMARDNCPVQIVARSGDTTVSVTTVHTDDRGEYRAARLAPGTYFVLANKTGPWTSTMRVFRDTFYPRALNVASAAPIALAAGQQARADIRMISSSGVDITGRIVSAAGAGTGDSSTRVLLYRPESLQTPGGGLAEAGGGQFLLRNVLPGKYVLMALTRASATGGTEGKPLYGALRQVEVGDQNMDGVEVDLQPLGDLPGSVTILPGCSAVPVRVLAAGRNRLGPSQAETAVTGGGGVYLERPDSGQTQTDCRGSDRIFLLRAAGRP